MKMLKIVVFLLFAAVFVLPMLKTNTVKGQDKSSPGSQTATVPGQAPGSVDCDPALDPNEERPPGDPYAVPGASGKPAPPLAACRLREAPTGFDDETNDFVSQPKHDADRVIFEGVEVIEDGLGPVYNAQACSACHQNTVTGGISQVTELRAGYLINGQFVPPDITITDEAGTGTVTIPARSLINDRAICPAVHSNIVPSPGPPAILRAFNFPFAQAQEHVPEDINPPGELKTTFRTSLNLLGDGFVEAINSNELALISNNQPAGMQGQLVFVPLLEGHGCAPRLGRFGWKNQHSSLLSFSADAYLNEMGITSRLLPTEVTTVCDVVQDPEDVDNDIDVFTQFMRATKAPPRALLTELNDPDTLAGFNLFNNMPGAPAKQSCATCHVQTIRTADTGTTLGGGLITIPAALGCKIIHPFGDFLLHNIGTGDFIVQTTFPCTNTLDQSTQQKMRTAPLWGVRTRDRLMHDGESLTFNQAILRHNGEAHNVIVAYMALSNPDKNKLIKFLKSL